MKLFARRALDKIHQLAQIEYLSSDKSSIKVFSEATVKVNFFLEHIQVLFSLQLWYLNVQFWRVIRQ